MTVLAVTMGDPAGIGPEVSEKALRTLRTEHPDVDVVVVGPRGLAAPLAARVGARAHEVSAFTGVAGQASASSGEVSLAALDAAIAMCKSGHADAIVTAPISKHALALAGSDDRGHTEILAREMARGPTAMAFFSPQLRTVLVTVHVPLAKAIAALTIERVVETAAVFDAALRKYVGLPRPRLALAALNPHAGEEGLLGDEEQNVLSPAVRVARGRDIDLSGPHPADTLFRRAVDGEFDGVVALYHDQALIPVKLLGFGDAVNVTLGLSHPRTSPDHGTAFDIAGLGRASESGMLSALRLAVELCRVEP